VNALRVTLDHVHSCIEKLQTEVKETRERVARIEGALGASKRI
jgi:predicted  nucleic acid-binding Zn-ribbon protein